MPSYRRVTIDGEIKLIPADPPAAHQNPSLAELNAVYREDDAARRAETNDTIDTITGALRQSVYPGAKRVQKPLRAPQAA